MRRPELSRTEVDGRQAGLTIRIDFGTFGYLGPGKIALMELISKHGSIAAAGREMKMSYRRAWLLVDEINHIFREPLVDRQMGGSGGGGAHLTKLGRNVVGRYRAIEGAAATASAADLASTEGVPSEPALPAGRRRRLNVSNTITRHWPRRRHRTWPGLVHSSCGGRERRS